MRRAFAYICAALFCTAPAFAQDRAQSLADIRQELTVLNVEMQKLKRELSTTGSPSNANLQGTSALDRINAMEAELQRLTAQTEMLTNRVDRIVRDGTNRIGDLEFRLVELEGGDVSKLGETSTLGGDAGSVVAALPEQPQTSEGQLAVGEQADFDRAREAFDNGSYDVAANQFASFAENYTGGALTIEAHYWRGKALAALGNVSGAARAYLESFSGDPKSKIAPSALYELGLSLDALGQKDEACVMLGEVLSRFPGTNEAEQARGTRSQFGCL